MDKKHLVDRDILFYAFRYALGRRSYAPAVVVDNIKANIRNISKGDIKAYIREISECDDLGDEMDVRFWNGFKNYLENELKNHYV